MQALRAILRELFHECHWPENHTVSAAILTPLEPSRAATILAKEARFEGHVTLLRGAHALVLARFPCLLFRAVYVCRCVQSTVSLRVHVCVCTRACVVWFFA